MKNYLLNSEPLDTIPIIIVLVGIIIFISLIIYLKHKEKKEKANDIQKLKNNEVSLAINSYCNEKEMIFLEHLHKALPKDFIAFPRVGVDQILQPKGNKVAYNKVLSKYVDVCVFLRSEMKPVLIIDLIDSNPATQAMCEIDMNVSDAIKAVKLPLLKINLESTYNLQELRKKCYDLINVKILLQIR